MFERLHVNPGLVIDRDHFLQSLHRFGYSRTDAVAERGDFSYRGDIVDVFPIGFSRPVRIQWDHDRVDTLQPFDVLTGEVTPFLTTLTILPRGHFRVGRGERLLQPSHLASIHHFVDLEEGDLVVHVQYGIGRYCGRRTLTVAGKKTEHLILEYAEEDRLYVPCDRMHLLSRYLGMEGKTPKLYRLGGRQWQRVKEQTRRAVTQFAQDLLAVAATRHTKPGIAFGPDTEWQRQLEGDFPFAETVDQTQAWRETRQAMENPYPMDRLLCGDVGFGKTEVALRAAFKAVMANYQVAVLVPTTLLAEQHLRVFSARMEKYGVRLAGLSRYQSPFEQKQIVEQLSRGGLDVVIGTHRLLSGDVRFKRLGLIVIDEEQRFGVRHKEKLKQLRFEVDVLTLTATPIPRTLYMSLVGARDMSVIQTPPQSRRPVQTHVAAMDDTLIQTTIRAELNRKGQIYFVHNRVESIDAIARRLAGLVPEAKIAVAHGQMATADLERVMRDFVEKRIDVLVSTTIIESGLDIPNVNTLIVHRADMFGLADLYQLRGRVGRAERQGVAYFLVPRRLSLTPEAQKRLAAALRFTELGSGFKIAMEDLEIRGAGNLLGPQQSGYIAAVGFDLYCQLLRQVIEQMKQKKEIQAA